MKKTEDEKTSIGQEYLKTTNTAELVSELVRRSHSENYSDDTYTNLVGTLISAFGQLVREDMENPYKESVVAPVAIASTSSDRDIQFFIGVEVDQGKFMGMGEENKNE